MNRSCGKIDRQEQQVHSEIQGVFKSVLKFRSYQNIKSRHFQNSLSFSNQCLLTNTSLVQKFQLFTVHFTLEHKYPLKHEN